MASMTGAVLAPEHAAAAAANIRRYYLFRFLFLFQLWVPIWIIYLRDHRGISLVTILMLEAVYELMHLVLEVPTGVVADRWGRRTSIVLGTVFSAIGVLIFAMAVNAWWVFASYAVWAVGLTLMSGADVAFLHDSLAALGREGEFAQVLARGNASQIAGILISGLLGAPLAAATDLSVPVYASVVLAALCIPVAMSFRDLAPPQPSGSRPGYLALLAQAWRLVRSRRRLQLALGALALFEGIGMAVGIMAQPFMDAHGVPVWAFGFVLAPLSLCAVAGALASHRIATRLGTEGAVLLGAAGIATGALFLGLVDAVAAVVLFALLRFSVNVMAPLLSAAINREAPDDIRATVMSIGAMGTGVAGGVAKPSMGKLASTQGLPGAFLAAGLAITALGGPVVVAWVRERRDRRGRGRDEPEALPAER